MINYILCLDNDDVINNYKSIIQKFMKNKNSDYNILCYKNNIINNIDGKKIYLFDMGLDGLEYSMRIRKNGDYCSQIIVLIDRDVGNTNQILKTRKVYLLDVLNKDSNFVKKLNMYLDIDYNIINKNKGLCFKYNNELFYILYDDIYYIEKNLYNNDSTIVTKDNKYTINYSINKLMEYIGKDCRFFKSHRSCIINIDNIVSYDISNNKIKFRNKEISLISRSKKKELKDKLYDKYQDVLE